ncbi:hypothetical protein ACL1CX_09240, partial [Corynebacterium striatum]|uniref:hypothetical protein n=1 Tax=Corynebacterium striatum TaxID=43770 RepID=UPI003AE1F206
IFRQDAVLNETDHAVLRILVKFPWHVPDFPIYSNGTKPGALHNKPLSADMNGMVNGYCSTLMSDAVSNVGTD